MGKASISINIGALWNGDATIERVNKSLNSLAKVAAQSSNSTISSLATQGSEWVNLGNQIYNMGAQISSVGQTLTHAITEPMATAGSYCVAQAETFDTALANLNKTADLTAAQLEDFGEAAIEASKTSPVTADDILNAEALGAQLGISTENLGEFAEVATGLDIATDMGLEEASTKLARFLNIMNESDDAVTNYGSTIVYLGNNYATTESEIANMAERLAGASANTKLSSQDVLGLAAAMSSLGIKAEAGGSSVTTIFNNMSSAVAEGGDQLQAYADIAGTSAEEFAAMWQDKPIQAFELMIEKAHEMKENGENLTEVLNNWGVSGIRQTDVMQRLINNGTILTEAVNDANTAWEENTALTTEVEKRNQSLESRFATLQNNANAAAITVGQVLGEQLLNLADQYLMPVIDGVNDLATGFKNLDSPTQAAITKLGLIAVAAGPVLTIAGKLMQGVGNLASAWGKAQQSAAVFTSALTETDGSMLRSYASTDKLTTQLSVNGNAAVKAAGSVDEYVKTWESMVDSAKVAANADEQYLEIVGKKLSAQEQLTNGTNLTTKEQKKLTAEIEKLSSKEAELQAKTVAAGDAYRESASKITQWTGTTKEAEKAIELTGKECGTLTSELANVASSVDTTKGSTITLASSLKGLASSAGNMISGFLKANAAALAIGAITAAVGVLIEKVMEAKEKQELLNDVQKTAGSIMDSARSSASNYGDAIGEIEIDVDGTLTKIQELNSSIADSMTDFTVSSAKVDQYVATMQELGNKSTLTATEQWKLQQAVEGYNEVTGSAYQLTEDYRVAVEGENGLVQVSTDQINANAQAWRAKAEAQAYADKATEYMEAEVEAEMQLKQAQEQLSSAQERYNELKDKGNQRTVAENMEIIKLASTTIPELETKVSDLTTAYDSAASSTDYLTSMSEIAASSLSDGLKNTLMELPSAASTSASQIAVNFQAGIAAGALTEEDATIFTQAFAAYMDSLPTEAQADGAATAAQLSQAISDGTVSVATAASQLEQLVNQNLMELESDASTAGANAGSNYASQLSATSGAAKTAGNTVSTSAQSGVNTSVSKLQQIGLKAGDGYDSSLGKAAGTAYTKGASLASGAKSGAESWDATSSGSHLGSQFARGVGSVWQSVKNAASRLVDAAKSVMGFSVPDEGPWSGAEKGGVTSGKHLGENFAAGMIAAIPSVKSAATSLMSASALSGAYSYSGAYGSASLGGGASALNPVVNNYSLNINGVQLGGSSSKVQELIQAVFNEYNLTLDME